MVPVPFPAECRCCGDALPADARFCPHCGERAAAVSIPPTVEHAPRVHHVERRPLGVRPVPLLGAMGTVLLLVAVFLLALGSWVAGVVLLLLAGGLAALFLSGLRQHPESAAARLARRLAGGVRGGAAFGVASSRAWATAAKQLVTIRWRRIRLRRELRSRLAPLGEAVHRDDSTRAQALKAKAAELQLALELAERHENAVIEAARENVRRERVPVQRTEVLPVEATRELAGADGPADGGER